MLPIRVQSAAIATKVLAVQILGGVLDFIAVRIEGLAGGAAGEQETFAQELLASMEVNGQRLQKSGSTSPFITTMPGNAFRDIRNLSEGFTNALDGFLIGTNRQIFNEGEGLTLRLKWAVPVVGTVDSSAAEIIIERCQTFSTDGPEPLPVYEGTPITQTPAQKQTTSVPNLLKAYYVGSALTKAALDVAGNGFELPAGFARLVSASMYEHEQTASPALILWDSDLGAPAAPTFTLYMNAAAGHFVQVGLAV